MIFFATIIIACVTLVAHAENLALDFSPEISQNLMQEIPLLSLVEIREACDAEKLERAVKWTQADTAPLYTLLETIAAAPRGTLTRSFFAQEKTPPLTKTRQPTPVRELFLSPEKQRLRIVLLEGAVKKIVETVSSDAIRARWKIERYYQLYLFTDDSDGNPLVVCVPEIPAGMQTGNDVSYTIHVAAIFYKPWLYESREEKIHLAPVLVGGDLTWFRNPQENENAENHTAENSRHLETSLLIFAILATIWIAIKWWRK